MEKKDIEIPFGAFDSELGGFEYTIPEGYKAEIKDGKVVVRKTKSEDEKIRKALMQNLKERFGTKGNMGEGLDMPDVLAWFEKQGEQKHTAEEVLIKAGLKPYKDGDQWCVLLGDNIQEGICGFGNTIEDALYAFLKDLIASQGEQKPADKVEPKFKVGDIVKHKDNPHLTYILKRFTDDGDYEFHAIGKDGTEGATCFAVVKYQDEWELVEQNPAWSEEDEEQFSFCCAAIELSNYSSDEYRNHAISFLESLKDRVQLKQEWSEEDEKKRKRIMHRLTLDGTINNKDLADINDWLKSLKPQNRWKPSGEQMKALKEATDEHWEPDGLEPLYTLYQDLKKLMEE